MCFLLEGKNAAYPQFRGRKGTKKLACALPPPKKKHFAFSTRSFFPHLRSKSRKKGYLISLASKFPPLFILAYVPEYGSRGGHFWPWFFCAKKYTRIQSVLGGRRDDIYLALFSFHRKRTLIWPPQDGGPKGGGESNPRLKLLKERGRNSALFFLGWLQTRFFIPRQSTSHTNLEASLFKRPQLWPRKGGRVKMGPI